MVIKMPKTYKITEEQIAEIKEYRKTNKDKNVEKRLRAVQLRGEGIKANEIATMVEAHPKVISRWVCRYVKEGIPALLKGEYNGNRRNLSLEEENRFITEFKEKAEKGECVTAKEIKIAYCKKIGHECGKGQIYRVLARQEWRKIVPRKEHPNKASEAEIEASKKLTFVSTK
jgi:transposase